jgi:hypothetical protein
MTFIIADRVQETTSTTGTGIISLLGASAQYQSFVSAIGNGNTTYYCITSGNGSDWEVGVGTVLSGSPNQLSRDTVIASSAANAAINLGGTSTVFCSRPAAYRGSPWSAVMSPIVPSDTVTGLSNWTNQSTATRANTPVGLTITNNTAHASDSLNVLYKAAAVAPVSYTALIALNVVMPIVNNVGAYMGFYDGTKLQLAGVNYLSGSSGWTLVVNNWTNTTTWNANKVGPTTSTIWGGPLLWVKAYNDGVNLNYYFSEDGYNFHLAYQATITNWLAAATNICFALNAWTAGSTTLISWSQGTS